MNLQRGRVFPKFEEENRLLQLSLGTFGKSGIILITDGSDVGGGWNDLPMQKA